MVLVAPTSKKKAPPKVKPAPPPPPMPRVEVLPAPPPPPPAPEPPPAPVVRVVADDDLMNAGAFFVQGEGLGSLDAASNQELRRWPTFDEVSRRFNIPVPVLQQRAVMDGWEGRRSIFQADLGRARQRGIAERIAEQEMPARLAYIGLHNDTVRGLGKLLEKMVPKTGDPSCLPRDLKTVLETACKAAELLSHATGKARESQGAFSLAVQVAQAQALGVPVASLPPGMQASVQPVADTPTGPVTLSLWNILVEARKATPNPEASSERDEWDEPSALPPHLASDRVPE